MAATETLGQFDLAAPASASLCDVEIGAGDVPIPREPATCGKNASPGPKLL
jgi:hypothetical protein